LQDSKIVYVVDDDAGMLRGIRRLLAQHGYESRSFQSAEALETHNEFEKAICIVLDINLGGTSGIELRRRLQNSGVSLPVIYITGKDTPYTRSAALESGCLAYLTKPFKSVSLLESIDRAARSGPG